MLTFSVFDNIRVASRQSGPIAPISLDRPSPWVAHRGQDIWDIVDGNKPDALTGMRKRSLYDLTRTCLLPRLCAVSMVRGALVHYEGGIPGSLSGYIM